MTNRQTIYRKESDRDIEGKVLYAIIQNFRFYLAEIKVYADGLIDCWELVDLPTFKTMLQSGKIRISLPPNSKLYIDNLGEFEVTQFNSFKTNEDFVKEIEDTILELNGHKGRQSICIDLFKEYLIDPNETNYKKLEISFNDLPSHRKMLFEGIDNKDPLIKLMTTNKSFTIEERKYMLGDYFDMGNIEIK